MSNDQNTSESTNPLEIEEQLINLETSLEQVKQRYQQITADQTRQQELIHHQEKIKRDLKTNHPPDSLKSQLKYIEEELSAIELRLESELFQWSSLSEPFWQAVRFLGLGIVIGWILNSYSG